MGLNLQKYGSWALVTGASAGLGEEYARQLAAAGLNVVIVARRHAVLQSLAAELTSKHNIETRVIAADLTHDEGLTSVINSTADLEVGLLINNAGTAALGPFLEHERGTLARNITLNVTAPMVLSHHFAAKMHARGRGAILILSSMVGLLGVRRFANYAATKAYDLTLAEGLRAELGDTLDIHGVVPGFTRSEYVDRLDLRRVPMPVMDTEALVRGSLRAIGSRRALISVGLLNRIMAFITSITPRRMNTALMGVMMKRVSVKTATRVSSVALFLLSCLLLTGCLAMTPEMSGRTLTDAEMHANPLKQETPRLQTVSIGSSTHDLQDIKPTRIGNHIAGRIETTQAPQ